MKGSEFSINLNAIKSLAKVQLEGGRELDSIVFDLKTVDSRLKTIGGFSESLQSRIRHSYRSLGSIAVSWKDMGNALIKSTVKYENTEKITAWKNVPDNERLQKALDPTDAFFDIASDLGFLGIGTIAKSVYKRTSHQGDTVKQVIDGGKAISKLVGTHAKYMDKGQGNWFNGLKTAWKDLWDKKPNSLRKELDKYVYGDNPSKYKKTRVHTKWAGLAITVLSNGYDNYKEFEDTRNMGRAIAETAVESTYDIGTGLLLATLMPPPAVVATLAGAATVWAVDGICKFAFGEDFSLKETVSDFLVDAGETVVREIGKSVTQAWEAGNNIARSAANAVSQSVNAVKSGWNAIKTGWKSVFGF